MVALHPNDEAAPEGLPAMRFPDFFRFRGVLP